MSGGYQKLLEIDLDLQDSQDEEQSEWELEDKKAADGLPGNTSGSLAQQQKQSSSSTFGFLKKFLKRQPASQSNKDKSDKPDAKKVATKALPPPTPLSSKNLAKEHNERTDALVEMICTPYDSKDKYGSTLEYRVEKIVYSCLVSQHFNDEQDLEKAFQHISAVVATWNADLRNKKEKLTVEVEEGCLTIIGMSNDLLRNFSNSQKKFLSDALPKYLYYRTEKQKSIHAFLEEGYLEKGHLRWGADIVVKRLLENPEKINERNSFDGHSPLQHAFSRWSEAKLNLAQQNIPAGQNSSDNPPEKILRYLENVISVLLKHASIDVSIFKLPQLSSLLAIAVRSGDDGVVEKLLEKKAAISETVLDSLFSLPGSDFEKMSKCLSPSMSTEFLSEIVLPKIKSLLLKTAPDQKNIKHNCVSFAIELFRDPSKRAIAQQIASATGGRLVVKLNNNPVQITPLEKEKSDQDIAGVSVSSDTPALLEAKEGRPSKSAGSDVSLGQNGVGTAFSAQNQRGVEGRAIQPSLVSSTPSDVSSVSSIMMETNFGRVKEEQPGMSRG